MLLKKRNAMPGFFMGGFRPRKLQELPPNTEPLESQAIRIYHMFYSIAIPLVHIIVNFIAQKLLLCGN
jgi:hypothetical protein